MDNIRSHIDYTLPYDRRNRVPHWVFEHLTRDSCQKTEGVERSNCEFKPDASVHHFFRSKNEDYKYSGFDRGHMAPAGNHRRDQKMCDETFILSNMAPQVGRGFNRDKWEHLERYARKLTKLCRNVYVCTGPQVIGQNNVAVPTYFWWEGISSAVGLRLIYISSAARLPSYTSRLQLGYPHTVPKMWSFAEQLPAF